MVRYYKERKVVSVDRQATQSALVKLSDWLGKTDERLLVRVFDARGHASAVKDADDLWKTIYDSGLTRKEARLVFASVDLNGDGAIDANEIDCVVQNLRCRLGLKHRKAKIKRVEEKHKNKDHTFPDWLFDREDFRCFLGDRLSPEQICISSPPPPREACRQYEDDMTTTKDEEEPFDEEATMISTLSKARPSIRKDIIGADVNFTGSKMPKESALRLGHYALSKIDCEEDTVLSRSQIIELGRRIHTIKLDQGDYMPARCEAIHMLAADTIIIFSGGLHIYHKDNREKSYCDAGTILPQSCSKARAVTPETILLVVPVALIYTLREARLQEDVARIVFVLKQSEICRSATSKQLHTLAAESTIVFLPSKARVFTEGEGLRPDSSSLYLILSGTIALSRRLMTRQTSTREQNRVYIPPTEVVLRCLKHTEAFGEDACTLLQKSTRSYSADTLEKTQLLRIPVDTAEQCLKTASISHHCQCMQPIYQDEALLFTKHKSMALRNHTLQDLLKDALHGSKYLARCSNHNTALLHSRNSSSIRRRKKKQRQKQQNKPQTSASTFCSATTAFDHEDSTTCSFFQQDLPSFCNASSLPSPLSTRMSPPRQHYYNPMLEKDSRSISNLLSPTSSDETRSKLPPLCSSSEK